MFASCVIVDVLIGPTLCQTVFLCEKKVKLSQSKFEWSSINAYHCWNSPRGNYLHYLGWCQLVYLPIEKKKSLNSPHWRNLLDARSVWARPPPPESATKLKVTICVCLQKDIGGCLDFCFPVKPQFPSESAHGRWPKKDISQENTWRNKAEQHGHFLISPDSFSQGILTQHVTLFFSGGETLWQSRLHPNTDCKICCHLSGFSAGFKQVNAIPRAGGPSLPGPQSHHVASSETAVSGQTRAPDILSHPTLASGECRRYELLWPC